MRSVSILALLISLASLIRADDGHGTKCVGTESAIVFTTKDIVVGDASILSNYPSIKLDDGGKPISLNWIPRGSLEASSEKIAEIGDKEIYRFMFWEKGGHKDGDGIVCVWFGIQAVAPSGGMAYRPFLVFHGDDQVRW